jgi:hypothetical protein
MFDFIADALATILDAVKSEGHIHGVVPHFILGGGGVLPPIRVEDTVFLVQSL